VAVLPVYERLSRCQEIEEVGSAGIRVHMAWRYEHIKGAIGIAYIAVGPGQRTYFGLVRADTVTGQKFERIPGRVP